MTTNERLFTAGLLKVWDAAAAARDADKMIKLLTMVSLTKSEAEQIVATTLANPKRYGS